MRVWLLAARPQTLPAAIVPVLVGTAAAVPPDQLRLLPFLAALAAALLIQVGTNLANDYFDYRKGADTAERLGPPRVTQAGLIAPERVLRATLLTFGAAALLGLYLVAVGGWPILAIGVFSIVSGMAYTGGPWPLGYHGLGDLFVFVFFGLLAVAGSAYLQADAVRPIVWLAALPVGFLVTAILVVNNLRDVDTDRAAGKRTLAVRLGRAGTRVEYTALVLGAYATLLLLLALDGGGRPLWLPLLTIPIAAALLRAVWRDEGRALNASLKRTAQLHMLFGALFAAAFWL